jgi:hypothetical protein
VGGHEALLRDIFCRVGIAENTRTSAHERSGLALDEQPERIAVARDDRLGTLAIIHMVIVPLREERPHELSLPAPAQKSHLGRPRLHGGTNGGHAQAKVLGAGMKPDAARMTLYCRRSPAGTLPWGERSSHAMARSVVQTAAGTRQLSWVRWNHDGCRGFDVQAGKDVPTFDDLMIRWALVRGSLVCAKVDGLSHAINRQLWTIGYLAQVQSDPVNRSVVVEVSKSRG